MSEPLLTKDAINIGGHKLPLPVVGAVVGVLGVILILRARSQGTSVASVGTPAVVPSADTSSVGVLGYDQEAQLANLQQSIAGLQQQLALAPAQAPAAAAPSAADIFWHQILGQNSPTPTQDVTALELGNISWLVQNNQLSVNKATSGFIPGGVH